MIETFMITTFFRDFNRVTAPMWIIHVVAPPTIARGLALGRVQCEEKETRQDLYEPLFLPLAPSAIVCLAIFSTWLLADSIQDEGSCLDRGPCGFGRQRL